MSFTGLSLVSTSQLFNTSLGSQLCCSALGNCKEGIPYKRLSTNPDSPTKSALLLLFLPSSSSNQPSKYSSNLANSALHRICKPPTTRPNLGIARMSKDENLFSSGPSFWMLLMKKDAHWSQISQFAISAALSTCLQTRHSETMKKGERARWPCLLKFTKDKALGWIHRIHSLHCAVIPVHKYESVNDDEILTDRHDGRPKFRKTSQKKNICNNNPG